MLEAYRKDGSLRTRQAFARQLGNHRVDPELIQRATARLRGTIAPALEPVAPTPPLAWRGMPTKGTVKMFVLLVDFNDYPHDDTLNPVAAVQARIFGDGDARTTAPYESLRAFYRRSSYTQLDLTGTVLGWYRPSYSRVSMAQTTAGREALIKEALTSFVAQGHDFAQYDNWGNGVIDYFAVVWSGPDNGWSNFWWGYQTFFDDASFKVGGKTLHKYSWQWESRPLGGAFTPKTLIHETGHALGLPDYYDYDTTVGPNGGVGGLDMMDASKGDHNCFSKFLLDWITPKILTGNSPGVTLAAAEDAPGEAVILMPDAVAGHPFGEFFMVQNRRPQQNDSSYPGDGLLIWHVDSRLDPSTGDSDYLYDNSFTAHKLLKLMEADGLELIETSSASAHAGDYYQAGKVFGPTSQPASIRYNGLQTWLEVRNISAPGPVMSFDLGVVPADSTAPTGTPGQPSGTSTLDALTFQWSQGTAQDPESGITGYGMQVGTSPGAHDAFEGLLGPGTTSTLSDLGRFHGRPLYAQVRAMNGAGLFSGWSPASLPITVMLPALSCACLDNCQLAFQTVGPWTEDSATGAYGGTAARSATIPDNGRTTVQTWVQGAGTLSFRWKVSSEGGFDFLRCLVDGIAVTAPISGEVSWTAVSLPLTTPGPHFVQWIYTKDGGASSGADAAWVDQVAWSGSAPVQPTADLNGDGRTDLLDLLAFATCYGTSAPLADYNQDGTVDDLDLAHLLGIL
jgi:M6 family metalloprotease-like protein